MEIYEITRERLIESDNSADVFSWTFKAADFTEVTGNKCLWTREVCEALLPQVPDTPLYIEHIESPNTLIGYATEGEIRDDGLYVKAYAPLNKTWGKLTQERVDSGEYHDFSIQARKVLGERCGDHVKLLPSPGITLREFSAVDKGGCPTCVVVQESCKEPELDEVMQEKLAYADQVLETERQTFVRSASFVLGPKIKRETYEAIAEKLAPKELRAICKDFKEAYESMSTKAAPTVGDSPAESVTEQIKQLVEMKGL